MRCQRQSVVITVRAKTTRMRSATSAVVTNSPVTSGNRHGQQLLRCCPCRTSPFGVPLGQVVTDVAEDVLDLAAKEEHGHDDRDRDDGDDESVLNETLALFLTKESQHVSGTPFRTLLGLLLLGHAAMMPRSTARGATGKSVLPRKFSPGLIPIKYLTYRRKLRTGGPRNRIRSAGNTQSVMGQRISTGRRRPRDSASPLRSILSDSACTARTRASGDPRRCAMTSIDATRAASSP